MLDMAAAIPLLLRTAFGIEIPLSFLPESVAPWAEVLKYCGVLDRIRLLLCLSIRGRRLMLCL